VWGEDFAVNSTVEFWDEQLYNLGNRKVVVCLPLYWQRRCEGQVAALVGNKRPGAELGNSSNDAGKPEKKISQRSR